MTDPDTHNGQPPIRVSTGQAASLAGVSTRTIRRWIERGYLPAEPTPRGQVVSPADLMRARRQAEAAGAGGHPAGHPGGHVVGDRLSSADIASATDGRPGGQVSALNVAAQQLELLRESLLVPLIDLTERQQAQLVEQAERIGRLEAERDALRSRVVAVDAAPAAGPTAAQNEPQRGVRRAWWRVWER